jgi:hypothetical protein
VKQLEKKLVKIFDLSAGGFTPSATGLSVTDENENLSRFFKKT